MLNNDVDVDVDGCQIRGSIFPSFFQTMATL